MSYISSGWNKRNFNLNYGNIAALACIPDPYYSTNPLVFPRTVLLLNGGTTPTDQLYTSTQLISNFRLGSELVDESPVGRTLALTGAASLTTDDTNSPFADAAVFENTSGAAGTVTAGQLSLTTATQTLSIETYVFPTEFGATRTMLAVGPTVELWTNAAGTLICWCGGLTRVGNNLTLNSWNAVSVEFRGFNGTNHGFTLANGLANNLSQVTVTSGVSGSGASFCGDLVNQNIAIGGGTQNPFKGRIGPTRITRSSVADSRIINLLQNPYRRFPGLWPASDARPLTDICGIPKTANTTALGSPVPVSNIYPNSIFIPRYLTAQANINGVAVDASTDFDTSTREFTLEFLVRKFSNAANQLWFSAVVQGSASVFQIYNDASGRLGVNFVSSSGLSAYAPAVALTAGAFNYVSVERRGAVYDVYLNLARIASVAVAGGAAATVNFNGPLYIGRDSIAGGGILDGLLNTVRFVNGKAIHEGALTIEAQTMPYCA